MSLKCLPVGQSNPIQTNPYLCQNASAINRGTKWLSLVVIGRRQESEIRRPHRTSILTMAHYHRRITRMARRTQRSEERSAHGAQIAIVSSNKRNHKKQWHFPIHTHTYIHVHVHVLIQVHESIASGPRPLLVFRILAGSHCQSMFNQLLHFWQLPLGEVE